MSRQGGDGPAPASREYRGELVIEWPAPHTTTARLLPGWSVCVYDASTGLQITTVTGMTVTFRPDDVVTADVTMFIDTDGGPLYSGQPVVTEGEIALATFPFLVAEMRVRERAEGTLSRRRP